MILDNLLRTMNEYMLDIFNTFGGQSDEYMRAMRQVRENIPEEALQKTARQGLNYIGDNPTEAFQFSRGKKAQEILSNFESDLTNLRAEQRKTGTAAVQAQSYYDEQKLQEPETPVTKEKIKQQAEDRYYFNSNVNGWYEAIDNSEELTKTEKEDIKADYANLNEDYWSANSREALQKKAENLINKIKARRQLQKEQGAPIPKSPIRGVGVSDIKKIIK